MLLVGCGNTYGAAGSGRDLAAHRQRPAAVRKRTGRNLRAVISEKILFRPGRRRYIKTLVPAAADKHFFQKSSVRSEVDSGVFEIALVLQWADSYTTLGSDEVRMSVREKSGINHLLVLILVLIPARSFDTKVSTKLTSRSASFLSPASAARDYFHHHG